MYGTYRLIKTLQHLSRSSTSVQTPWASDGLELTYCTSIVVVTSISWRKSFAAAFCKSLENVPATRAPDVDHADENAVAALLACAITDASCVVFVRSTRMVLPSFALMSGVKPVTFAANLVSETILPICAL